MYSSTSNPFTVSDVKDNIDKMCLSEAIKTK